MGLGVTNGEFGGPSAKSSAGGAGTVTSVSVVTANGFSGTVANPTTTPAITISGASSAVSQIANTVLASPAASITFSAIPGTFNHLHLEGIGRSSGGGGEAWEVQVNNVSTSTYDSMFTGQANSSAANSHNFGDTGWRNGVNQDIPSSGNTAAVFGVLELDIPYYAATTAQKTGAMTTAFTDGPSAQATLLNMTLNNRATTAITSIKVLMATGANLVTGSGLSLYGLT